MSGLVEEIQVQALRQDVRVSTLLLKVKLAAAKLKLTDTLEWVDRELTGYNSDIDQVPPYRWASGQLMIHTIHHGTMQATGDAQIIQTMSSCDFREAIGSLEALMDEAGGTLTMPANAQLASAVNKAMGSKAAYTVHFSKNVIVGIVDAVRTAILDWSIALEAEGIVGEGISFSVEEKNKAAEVAPSIQITNNYGHIHHGDVSGDQNRTNIQTSDNSFNNLVGDVFDRISQTVSTQIDNAADRNTLGALVKQMQASKGTAPFTGLYQKFLSSAADYFSILGPFLPALAEHLPKLA